MTYENNIKKKGISIILILALTCAGLFSHPNIAYAEKTVLSDEVYYHLDMGVQITYQGSEWEARGYDYGDTETMSATIGFPNDIEVLDAYPLKSSKGNSFNFDGDTSSTNIPEDLIDDAGKSAADAYNQFYKAFTSTSMTASGTPTSDGNEVTFGYTAFLNTDKPLEVVSYGVNKYETEIWKLFGGKEFVQNAMVKSAIENALLQGANGTANGNKLYLVFCPTVIAYKKYITVGDLEASLSLPSSAKQGDDYTAKDNSYIDSNLTVEDAILEKHYGDGNWETVATWSGPGGPGKNTGESISESCDEICTITYRITVTTTSGQTDTDTKTISITDGREITCVADLILPTYTYEGHTELAKDASTFEVDGVAYSATRAYAEKVASNRFKANSSTVSTNQLTDTKAECTFSKQGTYSVVLTVKPASGSSVSDTESIDVRKTPYIEDGLSGFQKQNRKQVLTATVATYPGKPLTDYAITLKDKVTGDSVILTPDNLQQNTSTIKTRAVTMTQDVEKGFAYITVEFLTKTPAYNSADTDYSQQFYYQINVTDSKGDTDSASSYFDVTPDIPPAAAISLDTAFLRNEGTNVATIKPEDVTVAADGDSVARTWYYGATTSPATFTNVSTMDGYSKLSFGTDKIVGFNATGVGKFTTKLFVKEVWTEPTLEEYVSNSDYLTSTATAYSEVQNVAPIVSLELLKGIEQEILLLANNDAEYQTLLNKKTSLQQALLANKIDGQIIIKKLIGNSPLGVTGIKEQLSYEFPAPLWKSGMEDDIVKDVLTADSEKTYLAEWTVAGSSLTVPITVHAYNPFVGEVWSYTTTRNEQFTFGNDDTGKYLYLIYKTSNQTVVLDKRTGAVAGTINMALSDKVWLSDNLAFISKPPSIYTTNNNLYAIDLNSFAEVLIDENVSAVSRVAGNLQYITKEESGIVRNILDMENMSIEKQLLIDTGNSVSSPNHYMVFCIDSTGKVVLLKEAGNGTDTFSGVLVYNADNSLQKQISCPVGFEGEGYDLDISYTLDENGGCNHVMVWTEDDTGVNTHSLRCVNLNTSVIGSWTKRTDALNDIGFNAMFEVGGKSYFYYNGWYYTGESGYWGPAYIFAFNGTTLNLTSEGSIGNSDENYKASDRIITSLYSNNTSGPLQMKISSFSKTLVQETKELISKFCGKLTFLGDVNTTADEIKITAEAPRPAIKVAATQNGYLTMSNLGLMPNKKYYYEYETKPLTDAAGTGLSGIAASTGSTTSTQSFNSDTLYTNDSYEENFDDSKINKFFTVSDPGGFVNGCYGDYYKASSDNDGYTCLTFTVPSGKQGILSFDYNFYFQQSYYDGTNIFVDGLRMDEEPTTTGESSGYVDRRKSKIFYKILYPGKHTIECKVSAKSGYWTNVLIDNLRVDILSPTANNGSDTYQISEENNWKTFSGSFKTPNRVISYGAQNSSHYYGGLPSAVTETYYYKAVDYPQTREYYESVPTGYLRKGFAHIGSTYLSSYNSVTYTISGFSGYKISASGGDNSGAVDEWRYMGIRPGGSYTHIAEEGSKPYQYDGWIDTIDTVTYPDNAVTQTGNMAFNSENTEYFFPKVSSNGKTTLTMYIPKGEYLIKNLKMYYMEDGRKIYLQNEDCEELTDLSKWSLSAGLTASVVTPTDDENVDDEYVKIYKKGEKVLYNIFYSDYENDPSKTGYWVYTHVNWPPDVVHPDIGKILTAPIDRFYLSGKYTVTHWEVDNTQRTGTVGDATPYNKESNKVTMTFYVDGEGNAPWINYIKTTPATVKETNAYTIQVGVDDTEKDTLALETEVYLNGSLILTDKKTGINVDSNGDYPVQTVSGLPTAKVGTYQVVCTVSDYSGTGIKSYKFTVISDGKITGLVNHTEAWEKNRKQYNLAHFADEINIAYSYSSYTALAKPRRRGTNIFWSGEKFVLQADVAGTPVSVNCSIDGFSYNSVMKSSGRKNSKNETIYVGTLWDDDMLNKWGNETPQQLTFTFTATYSGGIKKEDKATVIIDNSVSYWQLHRDF